MDDVTPPTKVLPSSLRRSPAPRRALLSAAIAGLLGTTAACDGEEASPSVPSEDSGVGDASASPSSDAGTGTSDAQQAAADATQQAADAVEESDAAAVSDAEEEATAPDPTDAGVEAMDSGAADSAAAAAEDAASPSEAPDCSQAEITATSTEPEMTLERFTEECDALEGEVELHAACGGVNTCAGLSFDDATFELTEHTCCAVNTCSGYSCVLGDDGE